MERRIIKYLSIFMFFGIFILIFNHMSRGLNWEPLMWLLLPTFAMMVVYND